MILELLTITRCALPSELLNALGYNTIILLLPHVPLLTCSHVRIVFCIIGLENVFLHLVYGNMYNKKKFNELKIK